MATPKTRENNLPINSAKSKVEVVKIMADGVFEYLVRDNKVAGFRLKQKHAKPKTKEE